MISEFTHLAPHFLGLFMIALACVPVIFILQDRHRLQLRRTTRGAREAASRRTENMVGGPTATPRH